MEKTKYKNLIRTNFLRCLSALKQQKIVRSDREFAISLDYLPQSLSEVKRGSRGIMSELIAKAVEKYCFNPTFIYTGNGPLFIDVIDADLYTDVELRHLQMAMQIQGYSFDFKLLYTFRETCKGLVKMGGDFGIKESAEIKAESDRLFPDESISNIGKIGNIIRFDETPIKNTINTNQTRVEMAEQFAKTAHDNQFYGEYPYGFHLRKTFEVAQRFGLNNRIKVACWLHDTIEDTNVIHEDLESIFGEQIADMVQSVTVFGDNRKEKQHLLFQQLLESSHNDCVLLKCCDRIANIEHAQAHNSEKYIKMYEAEHQAFVDFGEKHFELATRLPIWSYLVNVFEKD